MKVKTFRAQSMREALALVRRSFGGEAVILYTKSVRAPGLWGYFGRQVVEVAAASDVPRHATLAVEPQAAPAPIATRAVAEAYARPEAPAAHSPNDQLKRLREEVAGIRTALDDLVKSNCPPSVAGLPEPLTEGYLTLVRHGVAETLAAEVARGAAEELATQPTLMPEVLRASMTRRLAGHVAVAGGIELNGARRVVALVGPTGVGKTTTIAKLAANFKVRQHRSVALVTIDTYRIAAVQQLQTIADIIQVPLMTVLTVGDLRQALDGLRHYDLVLIDTAGRSQRDELKMFDLDAFLKAAAADEVHLVVSAAASLGNMAEVIDRFKPLGPTRLIVTKVDEAEALGRLASVSSRCGLPLSYVTTGQDIPNDIELAAPERVAAMAWER